MAPFLFVTAMLFILGLAIGSFLNVVIYRAVHNDSPLRGRSYCDNCKKPIVWYDNIPLLSFVMLHRRCRHCKQVIPWEYPAVELLTGMLFVWWFIVGSTFFQLSSQPLHIIQPIFWLIVGLLFVVICFADLSYYIIPDSAVLLLTIFSVVYRVLLYSQGIMMRNDFIACFVASIGASLFFFLLVVVTRGKGMGLGDVKLAFPLGLILGFPGIILGIFLSFISGALIALGLLATQKTKLRSQIPFGPFLILGSVVTLVWGEKIISWYMHFL